MKNSCALIVGGTSGLGMKLALQLERRDFLPIVAGRSANAPGVTERFSPDTIFVGLDVTDPRTYESLTFIEELPLPVSHVFLVSGVFMRKPFLDMTWHDIDALVETNFSGLLKVLLIVDGLIPKSQPYRLVVVASTSSWRLRTNEAVYCATKAAEAAFTRNFVAELTEARPGSQVTLVNPGGMQTKLFHGSGQDTSDYMDPYRVAHLIVEHVREQTGDFSELDIVRGENGKITVIPKTTWGARAPEPSAA